MGRRIGAVMLAGVLLAVPDVARAAQGHAPAVLVPGTTGYLDDADLFIVAHDAVVAPPRGLPALPEPAIFIMMVLGVCVLGYRSRHAADDTFY